MTLLDTSKLPRHIAIIPDGNGRWAEVQGLPRNEGHRRGSDNVREIVSRCHELGIKMLTIYAFSQENWNRPRDEVDAIMELLAHYLQHETDELVEKGVRIDSIGRLDELSPAIQKDITELMRRTEGNDSMRVTFALSYSGRAELVDAVRAIVREAESGQLDPEAIDEKTLRLHLYRPDLPDPDLLIRTGDEHRISNFLLWQFAYTELYVTEALWPDFGPEQLDLAIAEYQRRERRFGLTSAQVRGSE